MSRAKYRSAKSVASTAFSVLSLCLILAQGAPSARAAGLTMAEVAPYDKRLDDRLPLTTAQLTQLESLIKAHPDEAYLRYLLARHQRKLGYTQLSEETMKEAQDVPDASGFFRQTMEEAVANDDVLRAIRIMEFAHHWHGDSDVGHALTAYYYKENRHPELASEQIALIMPRKSHWPLGVGGLVGHILYSEGKYKQAVEMASEDLRKGPNTVLANEVSGLSYVRLGNLPAALTPLARVFAVYPDNPRTTPAYAQALVGSGQYEKALQPALYSLVQAVDQDQLTIYERRLSDIINHVDPKTIDVAINTVLHSAHWTTQSYTFFFALAEAFEFSNRPNEALRFYASAAQINPKPTTALRRIGKIHQQAGRYVDAQKCYYLSVAASRGNAGAALAFNRLGSRLNNRRQDIAWQFKDWLRSLNQPHQ